MGIAGFFVMLARHRWPALTTGNVWLTYPLVYYVLQFETRYHHPIEWKFVFAAAYCLVTLVERVPPSILRQPQIRVAKRLANATS